MSAAADQGLVSRRAAADGDRRRPARARAPAGGGGSRPALARRSPIAAASFGNGPIDLTARANLQMRGVARGDAAALHRRAGRLGLLDADAEAEAVRNVWSQPARRPRSGGAARHRAGRRGARSAAASTTRAWRAAGQVRLRGRRRRRVALGDVEADVAVRRRVDARGRAFRGPRSAGVDGARRRARRRRSPSIAVAASLAHAFLAPADAAAPHARLSCARAELRVRRTPPACAARAVAALPRIARRARLRVGVHRRSACERLASASRRRSAACSADELRGARRCAAARAGARELRLTPWRALLVAPASTRGARGPARRALARGRRLHRRRPPIRASPSPPAPARPPAPRAPGDTRADARARAARCRRARRHAACVAAAPRAAPTRAPRRSPWSATRGRYDLVRDGRAGRRARAHAASVDRGAAPANPRRSIAA